MAINYNIIDQAYALSRDVKQHDELIQNSKPFIQNVPRRSIELGDHLIGKDNWYSDITKVHYLRDTVLISISDPKQQPPEAYYAFKEYLFLDFLDLEENQNPELDEFKIIYEDAEKIIKFLQDALDNGYNTVVHCTAGICRSGAVAEVGTMLGFKDIGAYRQPNLMVKRYLMKVLGWSYD